MKIRQKAEKGYILVMTIAVTTIVTILLSVIATSVFASIRSSNSYNRVNITKRTIKNDAYLALRNITPSSTQEVLSGLAYEIVTYENDSLTFTDSNSDSVYDLGSFILRYANYKVDVSFSFEGTQATLTSLVYGRW